MAVNQLTGSSASRESGSKQELEDPGSSSLQPASDVFLPDSSFVSAVNRFCRRFLSAIFDAIALVGEQSPQYQILKARSMANPANRNLFGDNKPSGPASPGGSGNPSLGKKSMINPGLVTRYSAFNRNQQLFVRAGVYSVSPVNIMPPIMNREICIGGSIAPLPLIGMPSIIW